jgi:hypothetical protein
MTDEGWYGMRQESSYLFLQLWSGRYVSRKATYRMRVNSQIPFSAFARDLPPSEAYEYLLTLVFGEGTVSAMGRDEMR